MKLRNEYIWATIACPELEGNIFLLYYAALLKKELWFICFVPLNSYEQGNQATFVYIQIFPLYISMVYYFSFFY